MERDRRTDRCQECGNDGCDSQMIHECIGRHNVPCNVPKAICGFQRPAGTISDRIIWDRSFTVLSCAERSSYRERHSAHTEGLVRTVSHQRGMNVYNMLERCRQLLTVSMKGVSGDFAGIGSGIAHLRFDHEGVFMSGVYGMAPKKWRSQHKVNMCDLFACWRWKRQYCR